MDKSKKLQRQQKTQYRDQVMEVEVELQGKSKVPSDSGVLPNRERVNDGAFDTTNINTSNDTLNSNELPYTKGYVLVV